MTRAVHSVLWALAALWPPAVCAARPTEAIYPLAGVDGGLVVHVGCGDGRRTADLRINDSILVHGVDTDAANVAKARKYIASRGLAGKVRVDRFDGRNLPYIDGIVRLIVVDQPGSVPQTEILRVLAPAGVAYMGTGDGGWRKVIKPARAGTDEWTHFLHGPDNNAVAQDTVVGPPFHIQWLAPPRHSRTHSALSMINVVVSSAGRIFSVVDEAPIALPKHLPSQWTLLARDAHSGVFLWKRPLPLWQPHNAPGRHQFPADLYRRLVAAGDKVFVTLSILGPVTALDAATGRTIRAYAGTALTEEILHKDGVLYLVVGTTPPAQVNRALLALGRRKPPQGRVAAVDVETGKVLWAVADRDAFGILPQTLAAGDGKVFWQTPENIVCADAKSGEVLWRFSRPVAYERAAYSAPTLVVHKGVVLNADDRGFELRKKERRGERGAKSVSGLIALDANTGRKLWEAGCGQGQGAPVDVFATDDTVWVGEKVKRDAPDYRTGRDLHTGEVIKDFSQTAGWVAWHHHRCYRDKATSRYILAGRTGVEYCDLTTGQITAELWTRGICKVGILPCNGLTYILPDQCACYVESKLSDGFYALAPRRVGETVPAPVQATGRLERGPAFGAENPQSSFAKASEDRSAWPTYRYDNARSACTPAPVPPALAPDWQTQLGGRLSAMVSAGGNLYVAAVDRGVVYCLDGRTGSVLWQYAAAGRVDSPPTIAGGLAVFGCRDGRVYALRASDGALAWRFRAAPADRRMVCYDQVESVHPVHGSVLVLDGKVYCVAGRSSYVDGGLYAYILDLRTGEILKSRNFYSRDPKTGARRDLYPPYESPYNKHRELPGLNPDIVSVEGEHLFLRAVALDRELNIQQVHPPHLFSWMGFLDDSWWERGYWIYGDHMWGGAQALFLSQAVYPTARIMAFDDKWVYGYKDITFRSGDGLFAVSKTPELKKLKSKSPQNATAVIDRWATPPPFFANAVLVAGDTFFAAGPVAYDVKRVGSAIDAIRVEKYDLSGELADAMASWNGDKGSRLWALRKSDGGKLAEYRFESKPVHDGMIAANGRLYIATVHGRVICWAGK